MKKMIAMAMTMVLIMGTFMGCSSSESEGNTTSDTETTDEAGSGEEKILNIFTWEGYFPQEVLDGFTESTGIKINYSPFQTNEEMLTKLQATDGGEYDLIIASDYIIETARQEGGLMMELDRSLIPNFENLDEAYLNQYYDPENVYTVPHAPGTPVIVYNPATLPDGVEINGYEDLWNSALADNVAMMDDSRNVLGITLKTMGKSFNEEDVNVLEDAGEKLMELQPNIRMLNTNNLQSAILTGEVAVGYMFTSQAAMAIMENPDLEIVYPEEGMGFGIDSMFIAANAPHAENAHAFINYVLEAETAATVSSGIMYLCPNEAAKDFLPEAYTSNAAVFIPSEKIGNTEFIKPINEEAVAAHDKIWTEFKQGQ